MAAAIAAARHLQQKRIDEDEDEHREAQRQEDEKERSTLEEYENSRPVATKFSGPTRKFVEFGDFLYKLTRKTTSFDNAILFCIILAVLLIGVQSYDSMGRNPGVLILEEILFWVFLFEVICKFLSESIRPWLFYRGPHKHWNLFDLGLCILSMPFLSLGSTVQVLRVARLMRLVRLIEKSRKLKVLAKGVLGGVGSMVYILLLMFVFIFTYSLVGVTLFSKNDPFHFGTFDDAAATLLSISTLDSWTGTYYVNYYGCNFFHSHLYTMDPSEASMPEIICKDPRPAPFISSVYFLSYVFMTALTLVAMFIGAITIAMTDAVNILNEEEMESKAKKALEKKKKESAKGENKVLKNRDVSTINNERKMGAYLLEAFDGKKHPFEVLEEPTKLRRAYSHLGDVCLRFRESTSFKRGILAFVSFMGCCLAADTYETIATNHQWKQWMMVLNGFVVVVFTAEFVVKIVAEKFKPYKYFLDAWNIFDFGLVVLSYIPLDDFMKMALRMLRLFAIMKLARDIPQMRMIIDSLGKGAVQLGYIGLAVLLVFYFFAILGIILFKSNDPTQFGNLHTALISLFQYATLDGWTHALLTAKFGCDRYNGNVAIGFNKDEVSCGPSNPYSFISIPYFSVFVVIGSWVMLNLFIGVITTSMAETTNDMMQELDVIERMKEISEDCSLTPEQVTAFRMVFAMLDVDDSKRVTLEELELGLECAGKQVDKEMLSKQFNEVDIDGSGEIDQAEFMTFMVNVNAAINRDENAQSNSNGTIEEADRVVDSGPWLSPAECLVGSFQKEKQGKTPPSDAFKNQQLQKRMVKFTNFLEQSGLLGKPQPAMQNEFNKLWELQSKRDSFVELKKSSSLTGTKRPNKHPSLRLNTLYAVDEYGNHILPPLATQGVEGGAVTQSSEMCSSINIADGRSPILRASSMRLLV